MKTIKEIFNSMKTEPEFSNMFDVRFSDNSREYLLEDLVSVRFYENEMYVTFISAYNIKLFESKPYNKMTYVTKEIIEENHRCLSSILPDLMIDIKDRSGKNNIGLRFSDPVFERVEKIDNDEVPCRVLSYSITDEENEKLVDCMKIIYKVTCSDINIEINERIICL